MNSAEHGCDATRRDLDAYVSNELLVEAKLEAQRHLEACPACMAEMQARIAVRGRLKAAVDQQLVPLNLRTQVQKRIRTRESCSRFAIGWPRWALAAAATLLVCAGVWLTQTGECMPALSDRPAHEAYIQKVSTTLSAVLKVGLGDHIHCAVFRKYPRPPPTVAEMEGKLGPSYKGLLPLVKSAAPEGYRVIMAHQCSYAGRKFVHLTLRRGGGLASTVILRKNDGESLAGMTPKETTSGSTLFQASAQRYKVVSFESGQYLAFVVSDLKDETNLQLAERLAPTVGEFLKKAAA